MDVDTIVTALIASGGTGVVGIFANHFLGRRKMNSDIAHTLQQTASDLTQDLREDNKFLREDNKEMHDQLKVTNEALARLEGKVGNLERQMASKDKTIAEQGEQIKDLNAELQEWRDYTLAMLEEIEKHHPEFNLPHPTPRIEKYMDEVKAYKERDERGLGT